MKPFHEERSLKFHKKPQLSSKDPLITLLLSQQHQDYIDQLASQPNNKFDTLSQNLNLPSSKNNIQNVYAYANTRTTSRAPYSRLRSHIKLQPLAVKERIPTDNPLLTFSQLSPRRQV